MKLQRLHAYKIFTISYDLRPSPYLPKHSMFLDDFLIDLIHSSEELRWGTGEYKGIHRYCFSHCFRVNNKKNIFFKN